jgi:putative membrane protein insertion efficiency factor
MQAAWRTRLTWLASVGCKISRNMLSMSMLASCRHIPSCSQYAIGAIAVHGPFAGFAMAVSRVIRCRPFAQAGYDPIPPAR